MPSPSTLPHVKVHSIKQGAKAPCFIVEKKAGHAWRWPLISMASSVAS